MEEEEFGDNSIDEVRWLCSLSESEIDLLVSVKNMMIQRASSIGHEHMIAKFINLKMLKDLGLVVMNNLKEQLKGSSSIPALAECIDKSNLSKTEVSDDFTKMGVEELMSFIGVDPKKRMAELSAGDDMSPPKKKRPAVEDDSLPVNLDESD